jgi:hypothetical protein
MVLVVVPYSVRLQFSKLRETLVLVFKDCSPIVNCTYTTTKNGGRGKKVTATVDLGDVVPIPLGDGRTLVLPMKVHFWCAIGVIIVQLRVWVPCGNGRYDLYLAAPLGLGGCPIQRQAAVI